MRYIYIYISEIFVRIIVKMDEISTIICSFKSLQSRNCTSVRSPIALEYLRTNLYLKNSPAQAY